MATSPVLPSRIDKIDEVSKRDQRCYERDAMGDAWLAATYAELGNVEEARAEAAEVLRVQPNYTIAGTARRIMGFKSAEDDKHFFDGLRKAGLPD